MKSELYQTIYRVAIFCIIATFGLLIGGVVVHYLLGKKVAVSTTAFLITKLVIVLGIGLLIFSVVVLVLFYKKYKIQFEADKELLEQENNEEERSLTDLQG